MEGVALVLGLLALSLIFTPELVVVRLGIEPAAQTLVLAQLYGATLAGLSQSCWIGRTLLLGGIYGRAIVAGQFAHALIGFFTLAHALRASQANSFVWAACAVYGVLAAAFGYLFFGPGPAAPVATARG